MSKNLIKWFMEGFSIRYYKKQPFTTVFFYVFLFIAIYSFIVNKIYLSAINEIFIFVLKLLLLAFIMCLLKIIFEKIKLR